MTKLQLLHRALNERLMAAVEQIMEMVGGTVLEYEEETIRVRKENEVLRRRLRWMEGANPADWPGLSEPVSLFIPDQSNPALQEGCAVSLEHDQESKPFVIKTEPADIADDPSFITPLPPGTDPGTASAGAGVDSVNLDSTTSYMAPLDSDPTLSTAVRPWRGKNKKQKSSFACPDCGKVFGREQTLMFHMRVHSAEKPYAYRRRKACFYVESKRKVRGFTKLSKESVDDTSDGPEQANRSSASSESHVLPRSAAPVKEQEPAGLSAAESDQTNRDKDPKNSTVKPVPLRRRGGKAKMSRCSQCSRVFARPCQLAMHMKTHSMRKPLANLPNKEPSGRDEKRKPSMRNIDAEVDEGGGQSVFPCPDCDKVFARSCWLTFHMKTHVHEKASLRKRLQTDMPVQTEGLYSIMLVKVEFHGLKKFIKLQNGFTFSDFITEVQSRFDVRTGSDLRIYDESQTEIEQDLLQELLETNPESTIIIKDLNEDFLTDGTASFCADAASLMIRSSSDLNVTPERHAKRPKTAEEVNEYEATSAKEMVLGALKEKPRGEDVLEEYKATNSLSNEMRRILVNILVGHMTERHGRIPTREQREHYALGIVTLFPSLKDPFSKKGYEHFYDAESGSGYLAWRLKTVQRNTTRRSEKKNESNTPQGGPNLRRTGSVEKQLDGNALREAISLLSHTTVEATVFEKMRETFQHRQDLVHNAETTTDVLKTFPRFLDTKGLVNQDFILLLNAETSTKLLKRWNTTIKNKIIQEARCLTPTPAVLHLLMSAEKNLKNAIDSTWDSDLATLLLLIHLLPPTAGRKMATKISASDAADRLVVFHKTCSGIEEHVEQRQSRHPYLLAVGENRGKIDNYYIALDKKLIPCQAFGSLGAFDELFKVHFVFNISYNDALVNFYTFVQTTVYKIDIGNTKESPRVKELRAKLLNNT